MQNPYFLFFSTLLVITLPFGVSEVVECLHGSDGSKVADIIVVDKFGEGRFSTIQEAIDSIPSNNQNWIKIHINPGTYKERVTIPDDKPCVILHGSGNKVTTISHRSGGSIEQSATFSALADNIVAKGITFRNSYNYPLGRARSHVSQAVAARIYGDKTAFIGCSFLGFQDTLWDNIGRHYFKSCYIEGAVDFIFGNGQSFYEDCHIHVTSGGFITAQARDSPNESTGFVFKGGKVTGLDGVKAYLGRGYRKYSRVIYHETYLQHVITPSGWDAWNSKGLEGNLIYAEVNCSGPGSDTSGRVSWETKLDHEQVHRFSKSSFINQDGWLDRIP